ncbi:MAG TPA: R3H domain-containing nucleic acid-binding protein [Acidobacteriaceae bacterium]|nr:R3H domain-containing nucleic acid-binding protein [Acidobacteriaceae bacterium]
MDDINQAARTLANYLQSFTLNSGLRLRYRVILRGTRLGSEAAALSGESQSETEGPRSLSVEFSGPDTAALTAQNGELLSALEHIAIKILRLEPEEHDLVSFDADHFKANRDRQMRDSAAAAIEKVQLSGRPHAFPAMNSRERRRLHLILSDSGLPTASSGVGPARFVVLYPEGADTSVPFEAQAPARRPDVNRIRDSFRHR